MVGWGHLAPQPSLSVLLSEAGMGFQEQMLDPGHPYSNTAESVGPDCLFFEGE